MELKNYTSLTAERHRTLDLIQLDKTRVAIGLDEVAHLDSRLTEAWGIRFVEDAKSIADLLARVADRGAADRFIAAHDEAAVALASGTGSSILQAEKTLFDTIAHPEILGPVTSTRRHIIARTKARWGARLEPSVPS
jgi:hypothetical protein